MGMERGGMRKGVVAMNSRKLDSGDVNTVPHMGTDVCRLTSQAPITVANIWRGVKLRTGLEFDGYPLFEPPSTKLPKPIELMTM